MSPCLFNVYMDAVMKEVKMGMGRRGVRFLEDGREWRLLGLLYADDLVLCGESEEDLRVMVGPFVEVCSRRGLKVNAGKIKVMVLNGKAGLECRGGREGKGGVKMEGGVGEEVVWTWKEGGRGHIGGFESVYISRRR